MSEPNSKEELQEFLSNRVERYFYHIERKVGEIESQLDLLRRDVNDLQKSDSRQMMILILLVSGLLGLDLTKVSLLFRNLEMQQQPQIQQQRWIQNVFLTSFNHPQWKLYLGGGAAQRREAA